MSATGRSRAGRGKWIVGGVGLAALLYLLTRGGHGFGSGAASPHGTSASPCRVRVDADGIQVDGQTTDVDAAVARCRVAGSADVTATGAALVGTIAEVVHALREAGVIVRAAPSVWNVLGAVPVRSP